MQSTDHSIRLITLIGFLVLTQVIGLNCDGLSQDALGRKLIGIKPPVRNPPPTPPVVGPDTDLGGIIDPNCMSNNEFNACIFKKNPVAQNGAPIPGGMAPGANLDRYLQFGVNISGLDGSGYLQNSFIRVQPGGTKQRVTAVNGNWKFSFVGDKDRKVGQVMAYYWLNYQKEYCEKEAGGFYVNKTIPVITARDRFDNAQWTGSAIEMGIVSESRTCPAGVEFALGAEVYLHEMGHANLQFATSKDGHFIERSPSTHVDCLGKRLACCKTADGCMGGINEGQADYHANMVFTGQPAIGEECENSLGGFRDPSRSRNLSAQSVFNQGGEIHDMGVVFASVWYEVRKIAGANAKEVDRLFIAFLPSLQSNDTFRTALNKIKTTDQQMFKGKYSQAFTTEFAAHGIQ